jgi:hypothetical protein
MNVQNRLKKIQEEEKQRREDERELQKELTYAAKVRRLHHSVINE